MANALQELEQEENYFDFDKSFSATELPMIAKLQANAKRAKNTDNTNPVLDEDVNEWLAKQDGNTKSHINGMINDLVRHVMAISRPV